MSIGKCLVAMETNVCFVKCLVKSSKDCMKISSCVSDYGFRMNLSRRQRNYNPICMDLAVSSVLTGKLNPTQASREFQVPRQTIVNRLNKMNWKNVIATPTTDT